MNNYLNELFSIVDINRTDEFDNDDACNISDYMLLELCGGIPLKCLYVKLNIFVQDSCVYEVIIETESYYLVRTLDFNRKTISNDVMRVYYPNQGTGTNLLYNQVIAGKKYGFQELTLFAVKGDDYNGYYCWGRLGYSMALNSDKVKIEELCNENNIHTDNLWTMLMSETGKEIWKEFGFSWSGLFSLEDSSENVQLFKNYLRIKQLQDLPF